MITQPPDSYDWNLISFSFSLLVMWLSFDHSVTYCSSGTIVLVTPIVLWPIIQGDSFVPVMAIVLVTQLFSFTISTSCLWPYSLRLDFLYLTVHRAIRVLSPLSYLALSIQGIRSKASDCLSSYHSHQKLSKSSLDLILKTAEPFTQCLGEWLNPSQVNIPTLM